MSPYRHSKDSRQLALIGAGGFLLSFIGSFFMVFSCSLFLNNLGAGALPFFYITLNTLSVFLGAWLFARDSDGGADLRASNTAMAVFFAATGLLYSAPARHLVFAAYLAAVIFHIYSLLFYWNLVNHSLSMSEIKKHTGTISVWTMLGAIAAGFSVRPALALFSEKEVFLLGTALTLLFTLNLEIFLEGLREKREAESLPRQKLVFRELLGMDLVRLLVLSTLVFGLMRFLGEYQFSRAASLRFRDAKELSWVLGGLHAVTSCAILLWQTAFSRRFFRAWPAASSYSAIALTLLFLSGLCAARPGFNLLAAFNFSALFFSRTLKHQAHIVFLKAVPHGARSRTGFLLGGIAESAAVIGAGLFIIIFDHFSFPPSLFFIIAVLLAGVLALTSAKLNVAYVRMLLKNISPGFYISGSGLGIFPRLSGPSPAWETRNKRLYIRNARKLLRAGASPLALVKAIETLATIGAADSAGCITPFINHKNPWVKIAAITAVLRLALDPEHERGAMAALSDMAGSGVAFSRALAAAARKNLDTLLFEPYLETFLMDENMEVRRGALAAAARLGNPSLLPVLRRMELDRSNSGLLPLIRRALSRSCGADEGLLSGLERLPEKYRVRAGNILLFVNDRPSLDAALKALNSLDPPLALAVLEVVRNHGGDARFVPLLRNCLGDRRLSLAPLIEEAVGPGPDADTARHIFDDLAARCPRQWVYSDFAACSAAATDGSASLNNSFAEPRPFEAPGESAGAKEDGTGGRERIEKLFLLALKYALGWKTGETVEGKLMGRGESEELAFEIIESSVADVRMKRTLYRLLRVLKPR